MKRCYKCKQEKPLTDFHVDRSRKDQHRHICKECTNLYHRERNKKLYNGYKHNKAM